MTEISAILSEKGTKVSIVGKGLKKIPSSLFSKYGNKVEHLDFSFNNITEINNIEKFTNLRSLVLDNNSISAISKDFPNFLFLDTLWLNKNKITDIGSTLDVLEKLKNLTFLSLIGNPCTPNEFLGATRDEYCRFRLYVLYRLKGLKFLDSEKVTKVEREEALKKGRFYKVKKISVNSTNVVKKSSKKKKKLHVFQKEIEYDENEEKKIHSYFGFTRQIYTGKHSEGNRFIKNKNL